MFVSDERIGKIYIIFTAILGNCLILPDENFNYPQNLCYDDIFLPSLLDYSFPNILYRHRCERSEAEGAPSTVTWEKNYALKSLILIVEKFY